MAIIRCSHFAGNSKGFRIRQTLILGSIFWLRGTRQFLHFSRLIFITTIPLACEFFHGRPYHEGYHSNKWGILYRSWTRRQTKQMFPFFSPLILWSLLPSAPHFCQTHQKAKGTKKYGEWMEGGTVLQRGITKTVVVYAWYILPYINTSG